MLVALPENMLNGSSQVVENMQLHSFRFERAGNKNVGSTRPQTVVGTTGSNEYQDGFNLAVDHMAKFKFIQEITIQV